MASFFSPNCANHEHWNMKKDPSQYRDDPFFIRANNVLGQGWAIVLACGPHRGHGS